MITEGQTSFREIIRIEDRIWRRESRDGPWKAGEPGGPVVKANRFIWDYQDKIAARIIGTDTVDGMETRIVSFFVPVGGPCLSGIGCGWTTTTGCVARRCAPRATSWITATTTSTHHRDRATTMMHRTRLLAGIALTVLIAVGLVSAPSTWAAQPSALDAGRRVFEANCAMCHGDDAAGMMGMHPSLRGAVQRLTREGVEVTIRNGRDTNPPVPAFGKRLTDEEIDHVIAYIESLPRGPRNFGPDNDGRGMMGGWMWLLPLLLVVLVVLAVTAMVRPGRSRRSRTGGRPARELLDQRYAAGEITREEYLERRNDLER